MSAPEDGLDEDADGLEVDPGAERLRVRRLRPPHLRYVDQGSVTRILGFAGVAGLRRPVARGSYLTPIRS